MRRCSCVSCLFACLVFVSLSAHSGTAAKKTVSLKKVWTLDYADKVPDIGTGAYASTHESPDQKVRYPELKSERPYYGSIYAGGDPWEPETVTSYWLVVDESGGTGRGHDILYLDFNRDNDLTNDEPVHVMASPPKGATITGDWLAGQVCFNYMTLPCRRLNGRFSDVEVFPRLLTYKKGGNALHFLPTKAYKGHVKSGVMDFDVFVARRLFLAGGLDEPMAQVLIRPKDERKTPHWWGCESPGAYHKYGETYYQFRPDWKGKHLAVVPYTGALGMFKVAAGGREDIEKVAIIGALSGKGSDVAVGAPSADGGLTHVESCMIPVGDYRPSLLSVKMDHLSFSFSENFHLEGKARGTLGTRNFPIHVRKDSPFVLDFSNKPEIIFPSPATGTRIRPGEQLATSAVLVDPVMNIMIRSLHNAQNEYEGPKVTITRASGEQVAEGVMPFG